MTTIAYANNVMCADTRMTCNSVYSDTNFKKIKEGCEYIIGFAGSEDDVIMAWEALDNGDMPLCEVLKTLLPKTESSGIAALLATRSGDLYDLYGERRFSKCHKPWGAIGSGREFALATLYLGHSAELAVKVAGQFDIYTSKDLVVFKYVTSGSSCSIKKQES